MSYQVMYEEENKEQTSGKNRWSGGRQLVHCAHSRGVYLFGQTRSNVGDTADE